MPVLDYTCPSCNAFFSDVIVPDSDTVVTCSTCNVAATKHVAMPAAPSRFISSRLDDMSVAMYGQPGLVRSRSDVTRWEEEKQVDLRDRTDLAIRQGQEERQAFNEDSKAVRQKEGREGEIRWRMEQEVGKDMMNRVETGLKYAAAAHPIVSSSPANARPDAGATSSAPPLIARVAG